MNKKHNVFLEEDCIGDVYSNFDHVLDNKIAKLLKTKKSSWAAHYAWNFYGIIWFDYNKYKELIKIHGINAGTFENSSIRKLINLVNEQFGSG